MDGALAGKIAMVTGANAGMGKEVALSLASQGATVVMVSRDRGRGAAAQAEVRAKSGSSNVELFIADLSSQQAIRELVRQFLAAHDRLHVLVNNVGVTLPRRTETVDGNESVISINHLGPFLLTNLLLPTLRASAPSRVVVVASGAHAMGKMNFDDLQASRSYSEIRVYNQSKLANLLFTYELARRTTGSGVTVNAADPGFVRTNMKVPFPLSIFSFMRGSAVDGAGPTVFLASSPTMEGVSGRYFSRKGETQSSKASYDRDAAERLWEISAKLTQLSES